MKHHTKNYQTALFKIHMLRQNVIGYWCKAKRRYVFEVIKINKYILNFMMKHSGNRYIYPFLQRNRKRRWKDNKIVVLR